MNLKEKIGQREKVLHFSLREEKNRMVCSINWRLK